MKEWELNMEINYYYMMKDIKIMNTINKQNHISRLTEIINEPVIKQKIL